MITGRIIFIVFNNMNIYHSYIYFKNVNTVITQTNQHHLNFYSYLLSYILLKQLYGSVSMVCNKNALDLFVKYIPYDNIIMVNPPQVNNHDKFWSLLKINSYKNMKAPFIHVDGDVLIFKNLFNKFINGNYDILTQSIEPININDTSQYTDSYNYTRDILRSNGFELLNLLYCALNCGVFGVKSEIIKNEYIDTVNRAGNILNKSEYVNQLHSYFPAFLEQYLLMDYIERKKLRRTEIFDEHSLVQKGLEQLANENGYAHLWCDTKYNKKWIELIKVNIKTKFPEYFKHITNFENNL